MNRTTNRIDLRGRKIDRIGIVSDTHGWIDPRILSALRDCDLVLHGGDVCGHAVLEAIARHVPRLIAVAGNNDRAGTYVTDNGATVSLYEVAEIQLDNGLIALEHGHVHDWNKPAHSDLRNAHPSASLIVYGHTHRLVTDTAESPWVVNPGAAGRVRTHGGPSWIHVTSGQQPWQIDVQRWRQAA